MFGLSVATDFPFETPLPRASTETGGEEAPLTFRRRPVPEGSGQPSASGTDPSAPPPDAEGSPLHTFESSVRLPSGQPLLVVRRGQRHDLIHFNEVVSFRVGDRSIEYELLDPAYAFTVELYLLGWVIAFWFERRGIPMLHASAIEISAGAVAFMASNKGGKSSLAAAFVEAGHPLLTDDILGIQELDGGLEALPGVPSMRMWPDQAQRFVADWEHFPRAHPRHAKRRIPVGPGGFGRFIDRPLPLCCLYIPDRGTAGSQIRIEPVPAGEAVIEMIRGSFLSYAVHELGFTPARLPLLGRIAAQVPVRRLTYPDGFDHLPDVRQAILADLADLDQSRTG